MKKKTKAARKPSIPKVGDAVIIRTVTHYYTGRIEVLDKDWIVLSSAAWIADTGRWAQALASGKLSEVEPYPNGVSVARGAIVDCSTWCHDLPGTVQ